MMVSSLQQADVKTTPGTFRTLKSRAARVAKGITWVAGLGAAILAIFNWFPPVHDHFNWRQVEYGKLDSVHAGNHSDYVDSVLGLPAMVKSFDQAPGLVEKIYQRRDHFVMTVVDDSERVLLYSVLSCSPDFAPTFTTPIYSETQLQERPLAVAERLPMTPAQDPELNDRSVTYAPHISVSSVGQFIETGVSSGSNHARTQWWFTGVNSACGSTGGFGTEQPIGPHVASLPESVRENRHRIPANFYAETATEVDVQLLENGNLVLGSVEVNEDGYTGIYVSPHHFELLRYGATDVVSRTLG